MKKNLFLMLICCVMSMSVFAEDYTDEKGVTWKVTLNESTKEATIEQGVAGNTKDVVVPETITIGEQAYTVTALGYYAFAACEDIETISLPATIKTIANEGCTTISSVSTSYNYYGVFSHNKNLKSVDFNGASCTIGSYAFYGCSALTSVSDLSKCTSIGYSAFKNCSALTSVGDLSQCTSIGYAAFDGCSSLTSVGDLAQCTSIDSYSFRGCSSLALVDLSQCTSIDVEAFYGCTALTLVDLSQCTSIGGSAFRDCSALTSVGDLSKCTSIGTSAFHGCSALTSIDDLSKCTSIGSEVFYNCSALTSVGDLSKCTSIGQQAFYKCSALTSVGDLSQCTSIGLDAFTDCSALSSVGDLSQCTSIGGYAFYNCSALISVGDLEKCTSIGSYAFSGCSALNKLVLSSETMATAGQNVTSECITVLVPESLLVAYRAADNWKDIAYRILSIETTTEYDVEVTASDNSSALQAAIGEENLANVMTLKVKGSINGYDLMILRNKMVNLHNLDLSEANIVEDANHYCYYDNRYTKNNVFPECAFYEHKNISSVQLPVSITEIGDYAFYQCSNLCKIEIPENVVTIGVCAFYQCYTLKSVIIPNNVVIIDNSAFSDCSLSNLTFGNAVETIDNSAFFRCKLKTLTIPSSVKSIGGSAFRDNPLEKVYATSVLPIKIDQNAFSTWNSATLYVPKDDENDWDATFYAYYWDTQWSQFARLESWTPQYEYFYLEDDYEMETGEIPGTEEKDPDADLGKESGLIVDEGAHQDMGEVNIDSDGENGGSIIAEGGSEGSDEGNVTMDKLNIKIAVQPNKWYFFCFPFDIMKDAITCNANYVFRHYDGNGRANGNSGWKNVTESEGEYLKAGKGYIFQCDKSTDLVLTIENPAFNGKNKKSPELAENTSDNAQDANWNFVGNPFLSYFNLSDLAYNAPVTVWTGSTYEALRPDDDDYSFHPFQAFFIQKPEGIDDFDFYASGRETKKQSEKKQAKAKAMRAKKAPAADRKLINLIITDGENVDKTRVVFNAKKADAYEMDCDAAKFMSTTDVPQIYTLDNKNVKYAINERPSGSVKLGYVATKAGQLRIAAVRMEQTVSIKDNETGTITPLTDDYSFETEAGTFNERFVLLLGDPTGISELASPESSLEGQDLYNTNGVKVGSNYEGVVIAKDKKYIRK